MNELVRNKEKVREAEYNSLNEPIPWQMNEEKTPTLSGADIGERVKEKN
jgi:hypothetical protein